MNKTVEQADHPDGCERRARYQDHVNAPKILEVDSQMRENLVGHFSQFARGVNWSRKILSCDVISYVRGDGKPFELGRGKYGVVCFAFHKGDPVVVKLFFKNNEIQSVVEEACCLIVLENSQCTPKLIGLVQVAPSENFLPYGIVQEYVGADEFGLGTHLWDLFIWDKRAMAEGKALLLSRDSWRILCLDLAEALAEIHRMKVIQNDFKLNNIILQRVRNKYKPFIIDFGLAETKYGPRRYFKIPPSNPDGTRQNGTHVAPEFYRGTSCSIKGDVYALGITLGYISEAFDLQLDSIVKQCVRRYALFRPTVDRVVKMLRRIVEKQYSSPPPVAGIAQL